MTDKKITFGVCAPSSYLRADRFEAGLAKLQELGHKIVVHPQARGRLGETQSAGTVEEKLKALYDLLYDPVVDAVMFGSGGNFALHLLDRIDYGIIGQHRKPIIGFSDATALLNPIHHYTGMITYHGPMVSSFRPDCFDAGAYKMMIDMINGTATTLPMVGAQVICNGSTSGKLIGGNLEVFRALMFTPDCPVLDGAILFLEDVGMELNHLDRTLVALKHAGVFERVGGLVFGQFTDTKDTGRPFGFSVEEIINTHTRGLDIPVVMNAPFGHLSRTISTFPIGAVANFSASGNVINLSLAK